ncbi:Phosphoglycolate phosphatase [Halomonadaceae bacterium LMG 33818]|uniref:HAD-IA family hydrolase n=1 Tax=Cernens ardua TaxID=3402176 RepID=UPI003EDC7267
MKPLVIFDWDGTLMNSVPRIVTAMRRAAVELGMPVFSPEAVRNIVGLGLPEAIQQLAPQLDESQANALRDAYIHHFVSAEEQQPAPPLFEGVKSGLDRLSKAGVTLAVATGKSEKGLRRAFSQVPEVAALFSAYRTADKTESKPSPLMLQQLMQELSFTPEQTFMVGDSEYDIAMGVAAGAASLGVDWGVHPPERLKSQGAQQVVSHFDELVTMLLNNALALRH